MTDITLAMIHGIMRHSPFRVSEIWVDENDNLNIQDAPTHEAPSPQKIVIPLAEAAEFDDGMWQKRLGNADTLQEA